jgi:hypothetical protein
VSSNIAPASAAASATVPVPAASDLSGYVVEERFSITRTRRWLRLRRDLVGFAIDILFALMSERATGRLTIHLTEGSACAAEFDEQAR